MIATYRIPVPAYQRIMRSSWVFPLVKSLARSISHSQKAVVETGTFLTHLFSWRIWVRQGLILRESWSQFFKCQFYWDQDMHIVRTRALRIGRRAWTLSIHYSLHSQHSCISIQRSQGAYLCHYWTIKTRTLTYNRMQPRTLVCSPCKIFYT